MREHTKGLLTVTPMPDSMASFFIRDAAGSAIGAAFAGGVFSQGATSFPAEANARLWASAPEMYEALQTLLYDIDCLPDSIKDFLNAEHVKAGEDAIAFAEGLQ